MAQQLRFKSSEITILTYSKAKATSVPLVVDKVCRADVLEEAHHRRQDSPKGAASSPSWSSRARKS